MMEQLVAVADLRDGAAHIPHHGEKISIALREEGVEERLINTSLLLTIFLCQSQRQRGEVLVLLPCLPLPTHPPPLPHTHHHCKIFSQKGIFQYKICSQ
jgi:hypothetical protein